MSDSGMTLAVSLIVLVCLAAGIAGLIQGENKYRDRVVYHFGYDVEQGKKFKEQCEANLPRNVHCSTVVLYVPDNESEQ